MADIFISYARADRDRIEKLATALEAQGHSVWWDRHIDAGEAFARTIEHELSAAKTVVVAWSQHSHFSEWVKDEAAFARKHNKLFPVQLDDQEPPLGFRQIQVVDLSSWRGDARAEPFLHLVRSLRRKIAGDDSGLATAAIAAPATPRTGLSDHVRRHRLAIGFSAVALCLVLAFAVLRNAGGEGRSHEPSIAVLPFTIMSTDAEDGFFADGLSEEIINDLSKIGALQVVGRTYSLSQAERGGSIADVSRALGVAHILEGSVRRDGDRLRITMQLVNAENGVHLWSEIYDHTFENIFAIQEDIARNVADALRVEILGSENEVLQTHASMDPETERLFLIAQARYRAHGLVDLAEAARLYMSVMERQPTHGPAAAGYVRTLREQHVRYAHASWGHYIETGRPLLEKVLAVAPDNPSVRSAYAQLLADEVRDRAGLREILRLPILLTLHGLDPAALVEAEREALAAYDLDPKSIEAIETLAFIKLMRRLSPIEDILGLYQKAIAIDPLARNAAMGIGDTYFVYGHFEEAYEAYAAVAGAHPDYAPAQLVLGFLAPQKELGLPHFERARRHGGSVFDYNSEASVWFEWGEAEKAVDIISDYEGPHYTTLIAKTQALYYQGNYAEMADAYREMVDASQDKFVAMFAIAALANDGRLDAARDLIAEHFPGLIDQSPAPVDASTIRVLPYAAAVLSAANERDAAEQLCENGVQYIKQQNLFLRGYYWPTRFLCFAVLGDEAGAVREIKGAIDRGHQFYVVWLPTPISAPFYDATILGPLLNNTDYQAQVDRIRKINAQSYERYRAAQNASGE